MKQKYLRPPTLIQPRSVWFIFPLKIVFQFICTDFHTKKTWQTLLPSPSTVHAKQSIEPSGFTNHCFNSDSVMYMIHVAIPRFVDEMWKVL